ncbi:hypothetical protein AHAS_Ahas04G0059500 [Arachis hypogaea]
MLLLKYWPNCLFLTTKMTKKTISKKEKPLYDKIHDLGCSTRTIAIVFTNMSNRKKAIAEEMGFGGLRHIPSLKVSHKLLRELILSFDLYKGFLEKRCRKIYVTPAKIRDALGLNSSDKKQGFSTIFYQ